jgi:CRISP-associated protein Cas1
MAEAASIALAVYQTERPSEPERPRVDRAVLDFVKRHVFDPADFVIRSDGVCRLNPEMARMVVARVSMART